MKSARWSLTVLTSSLMTPIAFLWRHKSQQIGNLVSRHTFRRGFNGYSSPTEDIILSYHLESVVYQSLTNECRVSPGSMVLLSVSGGLDSMSMLHIMQSISTKLLPLKLEVVSFNHKLRPEAEEEISFVQSWATEYGMRFYERVLPDDQREPNGLQARAREWRRSECAKILHNHSDRLVVNASGGGVYYATAHHADDQVETMLLKLLRGSSISNLQGISPRSDVVTYANATAAATAVDVSIIRPLLRLTKDQLRMYMTTRGLEWREDESNESRKYKRNTVRLDLIPLMETLAGGADALRKRFDALAEQSHELQDWVTLEVDAFMQNQFQNRSIVSTLTVRKGLTAPLSVRKGAPFRNLPSPLIQREVIRRVHQELVHKLIIFQQKASKKANNTGTQMDTTLSYETISNVLQLALETSLPLGVKQKSIQLSKNVLVTRLGDSLIFEEIVKNKSLSMTQSKKQSNDGEVDVDVDEVLWLHPVEAVGETMLPGQGMGLQIAFPRGIKVSACLVDSSSCMRLSSTSTSTSSAGVCFNGDGDLQRFIAPVSAETKPFTLAALSDTDPDPELDIDVDAGTGAGSPDASSLSSSSSSSSSVTVLLHNIPIQGKLRIRFPVNGDRFEPHTLRTGASPVRLVDFLRSSKLPLECRALVPVITTSVANKPVGSPNPASAGQEPMEGVNGFQTPVIGSGGDSGSGNHLSSKNSNNSHSSSSKLSDQKALARYDRDIIVSVPPFVGKHFATASKARSHGSTSPPYTNLSKLLGSAIEDEDKVDDNEDTFVSVMITIEK